MLSLWKKLKAAVGHSLFKVMGWDYDLVPKEVGDKFVLVGFPHNSNMDAIYGICFGLVNRFRTYAFIKKEWMFWPMTWVFKAIGTIAVDRSRSTKLVDLVAEEFAKRKQFRLVIFPEGTRSQVKKIKTGFWHIAKKANVPIVLIFKDRVQKKVQVLAHFKPGNCIRADLERIQALYDKVNLTGIDFVGSLK